ncbi:MAG: 3-hydroxyacyl-CoA dehydrogenase [Frondihabitans sp.]|nr:3-hydroxyacyl-CoA dehydrogenase [Frondihabitans sp.]
MITSSAARLLDPQDPAPSAPDTGHESHLYPVAPLDGALLSPRPDPHFDRQPTPRSNLPDPAPLVTNLARCVVEILAGAREIEQIARWVTDDVYRHLLKRVVLAARARSARGSTTARPTFSVGSIRLTEPSDGVIEAVVIMHGRVRSRAVALRLEGLDRRWRATAVHVL